jgi:hypothetical protein
MDPRVAAREEREAAEFAAPLYIHPKAGDPISIETCSKLEIRRGSWDCCRYTDRAIDWRELERGNPFT